MTLHQNDVASKSSAFRLFVQQLEQANSNKNIKAPYDWPVMATTRYRRIPLTKGQRCGKRFHVMVMASSYVMMTSSNGNIFRVTGPLCGEFTGPGEFPHKGQWRGSLMFSLIYSWINDWVNNREAGDLRRHRGHYDVIVMVECDDTSSRCNKQCLKLDSNIFRDISTQQKQFKTRTPAFWGYPQPPHDYSYYWFILDHKSKEDKVNVTNLKNLPKLLNLPFFF